MNHIWKVKTQTRRAYSKPRKIPATFLAFKAASVYFPTLMGLVYTMLTFRNPRFPELLPVEANAVVDTGAVHLCIPEHLALQLRLETYDQKEMMIADGSRRAVPYMGPLEVRFKNRVFLGGALVFGNQVLLGAIPMEDMDLVVSPRTRSVDVNPESPNMAVSIAV